MARRIDIALVVLAACAPTLLLVAGRATAPADGTSTFPSAPVWGDGIVIAEVIELPGQALPADPLRPGDRVVSVDGVALADWITDPPTVHKGQHLRYGVVRDGDIRTVAVVLGDYPMAGLIRAHASLEPLLIALLAVAAFAYLRRRDDPAARALFRLAALVPMGLTAYPYPSQVVDVLTGHLWPLVAGDTAALLMWGAILHFTLVFPRARGPVARRPRLALAAAYGLPILLYAIHLAMTLPRAANALARAGALVTISPPAANVVPLLAAGAMVVSFRTARDRATRQRLAWVFIAFGLGLAAYLTLGRLPEYLTGKPLVPWDLETLFFVPVPLAVAAAVLRYRLFDVEVFLRRSLVYGTITAGLVLLYLGAATAFGVLSGTPVTLGPLLAGAVVVVVVLSLRERLRRVVGRLIFGDRDDPYEVVRRLGLRLEATATAESVLRNVVDTLAQALRLPFVAIELTGPDPYTAAHGRPVGTPLGVPLVHRDEDVGRLMLDTGPVREPFGPDDRRLLDGLARQVAMIAHNVLLTARLQRSLERTVSAREEERRRLRRDIHDGLGPVLASAGMRLELARALLRADPAAADPVLADLGGIQLQALADLRRLVDGLRPPVLDQLGLAGAVRERAEHFAGQGGLVVSVDAVDLEPLPAAVEVAAYHIVSEALTNVVRHAHARTCSVDLRRDVAPLATELADPMLAGFTEMLVIEVRDDGAGLPEDYRAGMGLHSIRERATELGGEAAAGPALSGGTLVRARLPLARSGAA